MGCHVLLQEIFPIRDLICSSCVSCIASRFFTHRASWEASGTYQFSSVQSLSCVQIFATPWIAAHQASLSITNSWSSLKHIVDYNCLKDTCAQKCKCRYIYRMFLEGHKKGVEKRSDYKGQVLGVCFKCIPFIASFIFALFLVKFGSVWIQWQEDDEKGLGNASVGAKCVHWIKDTP